MSAEVERWREESSYLLEDDPVKDAGDALATRVEELEAALRRKLVDASTATADEQFEQIADEVARGDLHPMAAKDLLAWALNARDLLAGRVAGGGG